MTFNRVWPILIMIFLFSWTAISRAGQEKVITIIRGCTIQDESMITKTTPNAPITYFNCGNQVAFMLPAMSPAALHLKENHNKVVDIKIEVLK